MTPVLRVFLDEARDGVLRDVRFFDDAGDPVDTDPPELRPVLVVVVEQNGDVWVGGDIAQALEVDRLLGLGVDGEVKSVFVDDEADRNRVRNAGRVRGRQEGVPRRVDPPAHVRRVHRRKYR